jgi:hypothetical protein
MENITFKKTLWIAYGIFFPVFYLFLRPSGIEGSAELAPYKIWLFNTVYMLSIVTLWLHILNQKWLPKVVVWMLLILISGGQSFLLISNAMIAAQVNDLPLGATVFSILVFFLLSFPMLYGLFKMTAKAGPALSE